MIGCFSTKMNSPRSLAVSLAGRTCASQSKRPSTLLDAAIESILRCGLADDSAGATEMLATRFAMHAPNPLLGRDKHLLSVGGTN